MTEPSPIVAAVGGVPDPRALLAALASDIAEPLAFVRADGSLDAGNEAFLRLCASSVDAGRPALAGQALVAVRRAVAGETVRLDGERWSRAELCDLTEDVVVDGTIRPLPDADGRVGRVLVHFRARPVPSWAAATSPPGLPERGSPLGDEIDRIIELVPAAVYIGDASGLRFVNREGMRQLGFRDHEDVAADIGTLAARIETRRVDDREPIPVEDQVFTRGLLGEVSASDVLVRHLVTGEERVVHCVGAPLRQDGRIIGAIAINSDVTEARRSTEGRLEADRREALARLAGGLAHDFNNLSMAAAGFLYLALQRTPEDDPRRALLTQVQGALERAAAIGTDLLSASRGGILRLARVDVRQWATEAERRCSTVDGRATTWRVTVPEGDVFVPADVHQLDRAVGVLIAKAAEATSGDEPVLVDVTADEGALRVAVSDTGPTLARGEAIHAFDPYLPVRGSRGDLALASVRGAVEQMGGRVGVIAEADLTTFWFEIARERPATRVRHEPPPAPRTGAVLVVEDEPPLRRLLERLLAGWGYRVLGAADGLEALDVLRGSPDDVALVISDVLMPRMGGRELLDVVSREFPELPVVLVTGQPGVSPLGGRGPVALLQKPFPPDELLELVRERVIPEGAAP